jgi:hypothetical protein
MVTHRNRARRNERIVAAVMCPRCGARPGEPCRNPVAHQAHRGPEDRREQPSGIHAERRTRYRVQWRER